MNDIYSAHQIILYMRDLFQHTRYVLREFRETSRAALNSLNPISSPTKTSLQV